MLLCFSNQEAGVGESVSSWDLVEIGQRWEGPAGLGHSALSPQGAEVCRGGWVFGNQVKIEE